MPVVRHFLGHATPLLPRAADWLWQALRAQPQMRWVVVVPTARAGRRLRELLAEAAGGALADPPRVVVASALLDALDPLPGPPPSAEERRAALALALMDLPAPARALLSRSLAGEASPGAAWAVAGRLLATLQTLWAGGASAQALAEETDRHRALAQLEAAYAGRLPADPDLRRLAQPGAAAPAADLRVALVGCLDLHAVAAQGLRRLAECGLGVHVLSPAEADEAHAFDDLGCVDAAAWTASPLPLAADELVAVEGVGRTHEAVLRLLEKASPLAPEDAVLVLGDEAEGPLLAARLAPFRFPVRLASGDALATAAPGALALALLALWREGDHAALRQVATRVDGVDEAALLDEARRHVLSDLRTMPQAAQVSHAFLARLGGLPDAHGSAPMDAWCQRLLALLAPAFPGLHAPTSPAGQALAALGARLSALRSLPLPPLSASEAAAILADDLGGARLPDLRSGAGFGEAVGLLEALLDEAPVMAVCSVVEGIVPEFRAGDPFLPGALRRRLGLPTEESLRARDKALLTLALRPRRARAVVVPRHGAQGDPLQPAQLLLEGLDDQALVGRALHLFGEARDQAGSGFAAHAPVGEAPAPRAEGDDLFLPVLPPRLPDADWRRHCAGKGVSVTALRAMLACPARFALKQAQHWEATDPPPVELEGDAFGDLLHEVLKDFNLESIARPAWRPAPDPLAAWLGERLNQRARAQFGDQPGLAIVLQLERARQRLERFAAQQAQWWRDGWRIEAAERKLEVMEDLPAGSIRLHGRVDRMDRHDTLGLRIIDFKTGDEAKTPRQTHLRKKEWVDLQLPLYVRLAWSAGAAQAGDRVEAGYLLLDAGGAGWVEADFTPEEEEHAVAVAMDLLERILRQQFPVGEVPDFDDGLGTLLCDGAADREQRLARAREAPGGRA